MFAHAKTIYMRKYFAFEQKRMFFTDDKRRFLNY